MGASIFDAREFGMDPANSGTENRRALQAMIDAAADGASVEIRIPPTGGYEIAGEVIIAPRAPSLASIAGVGGHAALRQTEDDKNVFVIHDEDNADHLGNVAFTNLSLQRRVEPGACNRAITFEGGAES